MHRSGVNLTEHRLDLGGGHRGGRTVAPGHAEQRGRRNRPADRRLHSRRRLDQLESKVQGQVAQTIRWRHTVIETVARLGRWSSRIRSSSPNDQGARQARRRVQAASHVGRFQRGLPLCTGTPHPLGHDRAAIGPDRRRYSRSEGTLHLFQTSPKRTATASLTTRFAIRLLDLAADDPTSSLVRERIYAALRRAQIPLALPAATISSGRIIPLTPSARASANSAFRVAALDSVVLFSRLSGRREATPRSRGASRTFQLGRVHHQAGLGSRLALHSHQGRSGGSRCRSRWPRAQGGRAQGSRVLRRDGRS